MWSPLLERGRLVLLSGPAPLMRAFHQELAHHALHHEAGTVLWADGDHGFNPYDFAELNLARGFDADWGDDRILVKRCMTPFQWDTVLTKHVPQMLDSVEASLVLAAPYDRLYSTDELKDWEQEDYVRASLARLAQLAREKDVPVVLSVDMARWWRTNPILAQLTHDAVATRWSVHALGDGWRVVEDRDGRTIGPLTRRQSTLWDFIEPEIPARGAIEAPALGALRPLASPGYGA